MVLDRDERVLQVGGDLRQRHVVAVLVQPEPARTVRREKPRVADAALQAGNGVRLSERPGEHERAQDDERPEHDRGDSIAQARPVSQLQLFRPRTWSANDSMK